MEQGQKALVLTPEQVEFFTSLKCSQWGTLASFSQEQLAIIGDAYRQNEARKRCQE